MALQTGQILDGKYRIIREIGHGSMGAVYEGENILIHRRVAIKVLHPAIAARGTTVQRFEREAQAAGRIGSDHIVEVLDLGSLRDGSYYMVMEFLEGITMAKRIRSKGRLTPREVVPVAQQLLTGLEAAHQAGIVHRDLKPDNVFLQESRAGQADFVKVLDFGVSKFNPLNAEEQMELTRAGAVVGTPFYMSPEQAKGARDVDPRSDLYSVGVILYEAITGQVPFHAGTFNELIFKIVLETPPPPEHFVPDLDPAFGRIIRKSMAREPTERYQSAAEMRDALSVWLHTGNDVMPAARGAGAPLPPPPERGRATHPPPPPQRSTTPVPSEREVDENAATRIVDSSPLARASKPPPPLPGASKPPPPLPGASKPDPAKAGASKPPAARAPKPAAPEDDDPAMMMPETPTPVRGIPGLRPLTSKKNMVVFAAVGAAVLALTAGGIAAVVVASPKGPSADATTGSASASVPTSMPQQTATAERIAEAPTTASDAPPASAQPVASASSSATAATQPTEAVAVADPTPQPSATADAPHKGKHSKAAADPPTAAATSAPAAEPAPTATAGVGKTKGKRGRDYATEL